MRLEARAMGALRFATVGLLAFLPVPAVRAQGSAPATPAEMVATYSSLADGILALKRTEEDLVRSILAAASAHGQVELGRAQKAIAAGDAKAGQAAIAFCARPSSTCPWALAAARMERTRSSSVRFKARMPSARLL